MRVPVNLIGRVPIFFATYKAGVAFDVVIGNTIGTERTILHGMSSPGKIMIGGFGPNSHALLIGIVGHRHPICFLDLDPYANTASNDPEIYSWSIPFIQAGNEAEGSMLFRPLELKLRVTFPSPASYWTFCYLTTNDLTDTGTWYRNNTIGEAGISNLLRAFEDNAGTEFPPNKSPSLQKATQALSTAFFSIRYILDFIVAIVDGLFFYLGTIYAQVFTYICAEICEDR